MQNALAWSFLVSLLLFAVPARPCGPGVHILESARGAALLAAEDEAWAADLTAPLAAGYLALGSISPDFQHALDSIPFGHSAALSHHLLDAAADKGPQYRLFALGHLAHVTASDPACEMFLTPTLLASAPIGIMDLTTQDGPHGESEGLIEVFGDLILGDWDTMVDVVYDFYMAGPEAVERGRDIFTWYCAEGNVALGASVDCGAAWAEFESLVDSGKAILGDMDRETARDFLRSLIDQPPVALAEVFAGGMVQQLIGEKMDKSANYDREFARFTSGPAMDPAFWARYDDFLYRLAPEWIVERVRTRQTGFPSWSGNAFTSGNVQSMMAFLPADYEVVPGLIVDDVRWLAEGGQSLSELAAGHEGTALTVQIRFFSAYPFEGTIRGVVRKDLPGRNVGADPIVGEASQAFSIDPLAYVTTPRDVLAIPFTVDTDGAVGLYLDMWVADGTGPWLTTNWDLLWTIPDLDVDQPAIRDHFGTYGHWPPSLRVQSPAVADGRVMVKARVAPAGGGIDGARIVFGEGGPTVTTGYNGVGVFDITDDEPVAVDVSAAGFAPAGPVVAQPVPYDNVWLDAFLHGIPRITAAPWSGSASCIDFTVAYDPFRGQVHRFLTHAERLGDMPVTTPEVETAADKPGQVCFSEALDDGSEVLVTTVPRYRNDTMGVEGTAIVWIDASPPVLDAPFLRVIGEVCHDGVPFLKPFVVELPVTEPHAPIDTVAWKGSSEWVPAAWNAAPGEIPGTSLVSFPVDVTVLQAGDTLSIRVTNAAGVAADTSVTLPDTLIAEPCPAEPDETSADKTSADEARPDAWEPDTAHDAMIADTAPDAGAGDPVGDRGGCAASPRGHAGAISLVGALFFAGFLAFRLGSTRRRAGRPAA